MKFRTQTDYYRKSSHTTYRYEYHFVWVPKYRYKVLVEDIKQELREILTQLCDWLDIKIIEGFVCDDHVHMYLSVPPRYNIEGKKFRVVKKKTFDVSQKNV